MEKNVYNTHNCISNDSSGKIYTTPKQSAGSSETGVDSKAESTQPDQMINTVDHTKIALFEGIDEKSFKSLFQCLSVMIRSYHRQEVVLMAGSRADWIGIVLKGSVMIVKEDMFGNRMIVGSAEKYDMFAEVYACASPQNIPVSVVAAEDCSIMWVHFHRIASACSSACAFHTRLIENMMKILASKNLMLNRKIDHLSKKTIRGKLMAFLIDQAEAHKSLTFNIPFSRSELADYLCIDRSAMSRELGKMRDEGLLDMHRNSFKILSRESFQMYTNT